MHQQQCIDTRMRIGRYLLTFETEQRAESNSAVPHPATAPKRILLSRTSLFDALNSVNSLRASKQLFMSSSTRPPPHLPLLQLLASSSRLLTTPLLPSSASRRRTETSHFATAFCAPARPRSVLLDFIAPSTCLAPPSSSFYASRPHCGWQATLCTLLLPLARLAMSCPRCDHSTTPVASSRRAATEHDKLKLPMAKEYTGAYR